MSLSDEVRPPFCGVRFTTAVLYCFCNREAGHAGRHSYTPPEAKGSERLRREYTIVEEEAPHGSE